MSLRTLYGVSYFALIMGLAVWLGHRAANVNDSHSIAERNLTANHYLELEDVVPIDSDKIVHRYLKHDVMRGAVVKASDVAAKPSIAKQVNSFAAVLNVTKASAGTLMPGDLILLCRSGRTVADKVSVITLICGAPNSCVLTAGLPKLPSESFDPDGLKDIAIATGPNASCAAKPSPAG